MAAAAAFSHTALSKLQYSPLNNKSLPLVIHFGHPTFSRTTVSIKNSVSIKGSELRRREPSRRSTPVRAVSATNFLRIKVGDVIINSPNASQQKSSGSEIISKTHGVSGVLEEHRIENGTGGGDGSKGRLPPAGGGGGDGGSGGGGGRGEDDKDFDEEEFGPIMKFEDVMREAENNGVILPSDMIEAAKTGGIRSKIFKRYLDLHRISPLTYLMRSCSMFRDRMLADPSFLSKVVTEIVSDTGVATFAKFQNKDKDFWSEFEIYTTDLLIGVIVNVAMVGMLAPHARMGRNPSVSRGFSGQLQLAFNSMPSSAFEAESQGSKFSLQQRIAAYFFKGILFGALGFGRGLICHGNSCLSLKSTTQKGLFPSAPPWRKPSRRTREAETRRTILPSDMVEAAKTEGIRSEYLNRYFDLQMVVTDSCSATYAEFQKKGKDFLSEFKIYDADLLAAATIDVALVGMLAPYARMHGSPSRVALRFRLFHIRLSISAIYRVIRTLLSFFNPSTSIYSRPIFSLPLQHAEHHQACKPSSWDEGCVVI